MFSACGCFGTWTGSHSAATAEMMAIKFPTVQINEHKMTSRSAGALSQFYDFRGWFQVAAKSVHPSMMDKLFHHSKLP